MAETYTGQVINGVIVPDEGTPALSEGTKVRIEAVESRPALARLSAELRALAGTADEQLPEDLAENLDHYLHGHPKR